VLCAIGKDGNDNMFPIAVIVAEAETRESYQWFINILVEDLCGAEGKLGWTIMSERRKVFGVINYLCSFICLCSHILFNVICMCIGAWNCN
jgi:hypothetical protein